MKEKNEPVLFVNSVSIYRESNNNHAKVKLHRLDDIKVLLNLEKEINVEVECNNKLLYGKIKEVSDVEIILEIDNINNRINLKDIKSIKIINTK